MSFGLHKSPEIISMELYLFLRLLSLCSFLPVIVILFFYQFDLIIHFQKPLAPVIIILFIFKYLIINFFYVNFLNNNQEQNMK